MLIDNIEFKMKDGRTALLRNPLEEDIEGTLEYLRVSAAETEFILRYPEECSKYTYEGEKELFETKNSSENECMIVCIVDGKVAGNCEVKFFKGMKQRHRGSVAIALLKDYWNQGIGTRMFEELIRLAEKREEIIQLELDFVENNSRARHLYEKMGFRITAVKPDAIRLKDGTLLNEYMMVRKIVH